MSSSDVDTIIQSMRLRDNSLNGTIPLELQFISSTTTPSSSIKKIEISRNDLLVGTIPNFFFTEFRALTHLDLSHNGFSGTIPLSSLSTSSSLLSTVMTTLDMEGNVLTGTIPTEFYYTLTNLVDLNLASNQLGGTISSEFGNLIELETIRLGTNNFIGTVPTELGNLTNLLTLNIFMENGFVGGIPTELNSISSLHHIN